jgi:GTP-binding protein
MSIDSTPAKRLTIAIVGRPNVGKSTLFNRLFGKKRALVHNEPGVTRDRLQETAEWWVRAQRIEISVIDTGGLGHPLFGDEIRKQVTIALDEADVVLFVLDGQTGVVPDDRELAKEFKRRGQDRRIPLIGVVNKVDEEMHEDRIHDFYQLGLDELLTVSSEHGRGIDDLKECIVRASGAELEDRVEETPIPFDDEITEDERVPARGTGAYRIAVIGRPNVGKSTLINALLGQERMITSPIAGTTVDSIDTLATLPNGKQYLLIDTAGIRRKSKTEQGIEVLSVVQTKKAIERCDVAILMIDGEGGLTDQDEKISSLIEEVGCCVILAVNKWDTKRKEPEFTKEIAAQILRDEMGHLKYAPILFLSAKEGKGFEDLGDLVDEIMEQRELKLPTAEFTKWVRKESTIHNPSNAKFFLCHQSGRNPPTFVVHVNDPDKVHFSLRRHLMNALRERWGYMGSPVRLLFMESKKSRPMPRKLSN